MDPSSSPLSPPAEVAMVTKLIVASGKSAGRSIAIKRNKLLIGRSEDCDVRPLSEDVSRRHCAVHVGPAEVWVEDLGSRNGTFVNGEKIAEKTRLKDGDIIRVGSLELKVSCSHPAAKAGTEDDVSRWLTTDEQPAGMFDTTQTITTSVAATAADESRGSVASAADSAAADRGQAARTVAGAAGGDPAPAAKLPGPAAPQKSADSSRDAAAAALKKFFDKR